MMLTKKKNINLLGENNKYVYDPVLKAGGLTNWATGKGARRIATVLLYDRIGKSEVYAGAYPLLKGTFPIGEYCVLDTPKPYFLDVPSSKDFVPCRDGKLGRIIELVKYSDDDIRVRSKLSEEFYKEENVKVTEPVALRDDEGNTVTDEKGEVVTVNVPKKDENGNFIVNKIIKTYDEPAGVSIEGRDAIRIHNNTKNKIKEFKERNGGFMQKYGAMVVPVVVISIAALIFMFSLKFSHDNLQSVVTDYKDISEANQVWWSNPDVIDNINNRIQERNDEKNAPPVT